jgi:hypothetical protein
VNKPAPPTDARLLDAQAMQRLTDVATEFAAFNSAASGKLDAAGDPASILTSMLADAVERPHSDVLGRADRPQQTADAFAAHVVWLSDAALLPGRSYLLKAGAQTVGAMVTELKYRLDAGSLEHLAAKELHRDQVAFVNVATAEPIGFAPYEENNIAGGFILIDRHNNATVAAGMIRFALRRAANTYFQSFEVTKTARARLNGPRSPTIWKESSTRWASAPLCWTATTSATGSIAIWALPKPIGSRTFAALPKLRNSLSKPAL